MTDDVDFSDDSFTDDSFAAEAPDDSFAAEAPDDSFAAEAPDEVLDDESDEDGLFPAPVSAAPQTGDAGIDEALSSLEDTARAGDLDAQISVGERLHRELQERLGGLGDA